MNTRDQVYEMLRGFDTTMLVTVGGEQHIHARPMAIAEVEDDGPIWLMTSASSRKIDEITEDARTLLVCENGRSQQLSISGRARVVSIRAGSGGCGRNPTGSGSPRDRMTRILRCWPLIR